MLLIDGLRRGQIFFLIWIWIIAVLATTKEKETFHSGSRSCDMSKDKRILYCNATQQDKVYILLDFKWGNTTKVIISNASQLLLEEPKCPVGNKKEVEVFNSQKITTLKDNNDDKNCAQQLVLHHCKGGKINNGVDLVRLNHSEVDEINLPRISQLDLYDSHVREVSVYVDQDMSAIEGTDIKTVAKLVIDGSFKFMVKDSKLGRVEHFEYNSPKEATFNNVKIESLAHGSFLVSEGKLIINNSTIDNIEPLGLGVSHDAELVIKDTVLNSISYDSIFLTQGATLSFHNVTVAHERNISFSLASANRDLQPLALLKHLNTSVNLLWVITIFTGGFVLGCLVTSGGAYIWLRRRGLSKLQGDTTELLTAEQCKQKTFQSSPSPLSNGNSDNSKPHPDEVYVEYSDVAPTIPENVMAKRPPIAVPDESASTGGSTLPKRDQPNTIPLTRANWKAPTTNDRKDDRDALPPPPALPDDEIYDDPDGIPVNTKTMPPLPPLPPLPLQQPLPPLPTLPPTPTVVSSKPKIPPMKLPLPPLPNLKRKT